MSHPSEFEFDGAVAILLRAARRARPSAAIRFEAAIGLTFPGADVLAVRQDADGGFRMVNGLIGLTGPAGAMPRIYTEHVISERRERSRALADFLDLIAQRPIACFAAAALKYRPHRIAEAARLDGETEDGLRATLTSLAGTAIPLVAAALGDDLETVLHHAGAFASHPRSADRLAVILSDWLARPVTVEQFAGRWVRLDPSERSVLPGAGSSGGFNRLGVDAAIGAACWDLQSTITIRVGPLPLAEFEALLPGTPVVDALVTLTRAYLDGAANFTLNPILQAADVPPLVLGRAPATAARLGWNTWLGTGDTRRADGSDALFHVSSHRSQTSGAQP